MSPGPDPRPAGSAPAGAALLLLAAPLALLLSQILSDPSRIHHDCAYLPDGAAKILDGGALYVLPLLVNELPKLDGSGKVQIAIDIPNNPALCGAELRMQAIYLDPGASGFYHTAQTNGLWWKVAG